MSKILDATPFVGVNGPAVAVDVIAAVATSTTWTGRAVFDCVTVETVVTPVTVVIVPTLVNVPVTLAVALRFAAVEFMTCIIGLIYGSWESLVRAVNG